MKLNENPYTKYGGVILLAFFGALFWSTGFAANIPTPDPGKEIDLFNMSMSLIGGLALFLFGMEQMGDSLKAVAGERMKDILAKLTTNKFMGATTGAFVTAVIQSSSVTTVLVVGFITAGLMSMSQSIGIIMGANIGTTITAQIVAFKVTKAALLMISVGFFMLFAAKSEKIKYYGGMIMGLGMIFFGMSVMSDAMKPLRDYQPFLDLMTTMKNPWIAILISAAFTGLIQSSSATTGIIIVMASQGFISLPTGIALAFGANIGTCVTAMLASIGKPREAVRAAVVHVMFNVAGVVIWFAFIPHLAQFITAISPAYPELEGNAKIAAEAPRQIANANTVFNVSNTFIFIWFTKYFAQFVEWLIPNKNIEEDDDIAKIQYLNKDLFETPGIALLMARKEIGALGGHLNIMMADSTTSFIDGNVNKAEQIREIDDNVDFLHAEIVRYLGKLSKENLTDEQSEELVNLLNAVNQLEDIGDILESDISGLTEQVSLSDIQISESTKKILLEIHDKVETAVSDAIRAIRNNNYDLAKQVVKSKASVFRSFNSATLHQAERLVADEPKRVQTYTIEVELIEKLKRVYYFARQVARTVEKPTSA